MSGDFSHQSVLLEQVVQCLAGPDVRTIVDCTLGGAGHTKALLDACPHAHVYGFDRDQDALAAVRARMQVYASRMTLVHAPFSSLKEQVERCGIPPVDVLLADLGVSSHQLDTAERGFSFRLNGPLDMRMDVSRGLTAAQMIEEVDATTLADVIYQYGEERHSRKVARAIVEHKPQTTEALARIVRSMVPPSKDRIDPATRTFQALRIWVNGEMQQLEQLLADAMDVMAENGKIGIITFHSLEDRLVKNVFRKAASGCDCPPSLPVCMCHKKPLGKVLTPKPLTASENEKNMNSRSRSAKMRVFMKK